MCVKIKFDSNQILCKQKTALSVVILMTIQSGQSIIKHIQLLFEFHVVFRTIIEITSEISAMHVTNLASELFDSTIRMHLNIEHIEHIDQNFIQFIGIDGYHFSAIAKIANKTVRR